VKVIEKTASRTIAFAKNPDLNCCFNFDTIVEFCLNVSS